MTSFSERTGIYAKETSVTLKTLLRQRSTLVWIIIIPLILTLICSSLILVFDDQNSVCVYVQDADDTNVSRKTVKMIDEQIKVVLVDKDLTLDEIKAMKEKDTRTVMGIIVLPQGYKQWAVNAAAHNDGKAMVYMDDKSYEIEVKASETPSSSKEPVIVVSKNIGGSMVPVVEEIFGSDQSLFIQLTPGVVIAILSEVVLGLTIGARSSLREKGVEKMIQNTGLRRYHVLFANFVCGLVPSVIVCAISLIILSLYHAIPISAMTVVLLFLSSLCLVSLGLLLSVFIRNRQSSSIAVSVILVPLLLVSGALIPISAMGDWLQALSQISPMTYMITGLKQSLGMNLGTDMALCVAVIMISTAVFSILWAALESRRIE